jgi:hypothetical protein
MNELEEYFNQWMMSIQNLAEANLTFSEAIFFDDCMKVLIEDGHSYEFEEDAEGYSNGGYRYTPFKRQGLRVDGYEYLKDRSLLTLYVCEYAQDETIQSLNQSTIDQLFKNTKKFFEKSLGYTFVESLEETDDGYETADFILVNQKEIEQVKVVIVTNKQLSARIKNIETDEDDFFAEIPTSLDIWDIQRFYDNERTHGAAEAIEIDLVKDFGRGIPALPAHVESSQYRSFLCVLPGDVLAGLYKKYGARLLEANVRSFLQFRGKVNRGMRTTLQKEPEMFFAYNNGITATAEDCVLDENNNIVIIKNLQIVNGGQTTASLFSSKSKNDVDLSKVFVQTKLSIVDSNIAEEIVPNISRYANTQNKVNDSDFFSNHPFHRRMQDKSRRILAPMLQGATRQTKWFYERARGQYQDELGKRTAAEKIAFQLEYPKSQMLTKTDLAKTAIIFEGSPHHAVKGAQIAFKHFAENVQKEWENHDNKFNDVFYKVIISKQIMFKECRLLVMEKVAGNAIQPTIAYTLYMLNMLANKVSHGIDFQKIWDKQKLDNITISQLGEIIKYVSEFFESQVEGVEGRSVLSFSKSKGCIKSFNERINQLGEDFLDNDYRDILRFDDQGTGTNEGDLDNEVELLRKFALIRSNIWGGSISFAQASGEFTEKEISLLGVFPNYLRGGRQPTFNQLKAINRILVKLEDEGFII